MKDVLKLVPAVLWFSIQRRSLAVVVVMKKRTISQNKQTSNAKKRKNH